MNTIFIWEILRYVFFLPNPNNSHIFFLKIKFSQKLRWHPIDWIFIFQEPFFCVKCCMHRVKNFLHKSKNLQNYTPEFHVLNYYQVEESINCRSNLLLPREALRRTKIKSVADIPLTLSVTLLILCKLYCTPLSRSTLADQARSTAAAHFILTANNTSFAPKKVFNLSLN